MSLITCATPILCSFAPDDRRYALRTESYWHAACRWGPHCTLQLAVRAPYGWQVPAARGGYRPRALDRGGGAGDSRGHGVARARCGRGGGLSVAALRSLSGGPREHATGRHCLPLLLHQ